VHTYRTTAGVSRASCSARKDGLALSVTSNSVLVSMASLVEIMATVRDVATVITLTLDHLVSLFVLFTVSARMTPSAWTNALALQDGSLTCRGSPAAVQTAAPTTATGEAAARRRSVFAFLGLVVHFVRSSFAPRIAPATVHAIMASAHAPLVT